MTTGPSADGPSVATRSELLDRLARMRRASVGAQRAPHKPLLVLWLLGRLQAGWTGSVTYAQLEEPVDRLIDDFGPPARTGPRAGRAAWPFTLLERELWSPRFADGAGVPAISAQVSRRRLLDDGAHGRFQPTVEVLLADPAVLVAAARLLLDLHFTPALAPLIADCCGLDLVSQRHVVELTTTVAPDVPRRPRRAGFTEEVLRSYSYACAICGYDGALGRHAVGLEAAHVRWHSQGGADDLPNGLALCSLHHVLFDVGALGLTSARRVRVSSFYVARNGAGRALIDLDESPLARPRRRADEVEDGNISWHDRQVFKA